MKHPHRGFTLIEVAISMVILGLVMTGLVVSLSQQLQQRRLLDTRTTLAEANDALIAFVTANARLPCPAIVGSNGLEATTAPGTCTAAAGFLPAVTIRLLYVTRWPYSSAQYQHKAMRSPPRSSAAHRARARPSAPPFPSTMDCSSAVRRREWLAARSTTAAVMQTPSRSMSWQYSGPR